MTNASRLKYHPQIMPYLPDMADPGPVRNVGYLWFGHSYPKGKVDRSIIDRLVALAEKPLLYACGYHKCNLGFCALTHPLRQQPAFRYRGRLLVLGSSEILVPGEDAVYEAPNLILHYILHHSYRPPECFSAAVLKCPEPDSSEYRERMVRIAPKLAIFFGSS